MAKGGRFLSLNRMDCRIDNVLAACDTEMDRITPI